jgi:hypothetical protein
LVPLLPGGGVEFGGVELVGGAPGFDGGIVEGGVDGEVGDDDGGVAAEEDEPPAGGAACTAVTLAAPSATATMS